MIYTFQQELSRRLLSWSFASMVLGAWLNRRSAPTQGAFAQQALAWGAIDAGIAAAGWIGARRSAADPQNFALSIQHQETRKLRRLLWINTGLDVLYVLGGLWLVWRSDADGRRRRGHGWGIVVQGLFLFIFDSLHALRLPFALSSDGTEARSQ